MAAAEPALVSFATLTDSLYFWTATRWNSQVLQRRRAYERSAAIPSARWKRWIN